MATRHIGLLMARGNTSDVYGWGSDAVVKVLRPEIPDAWAQREAKTTELVHNAGLPAPSVLEVTRVDGRPGVVFERIAGVSMWEQILARPSDLPRLARLLAYLQSEVNATPAPTGVPSLKDRLRDNVGRADMLTAAEQESAVGEIDRLPDSDVLCHFDIHPNNVLMGPEGPIIIDWFDAARGSPAADIVRSSVLMQPNAAGGHLPCPDASVIKTVHDLYLDEVAETRSIDHEELLRWQRPVIASRLAEPIGDPIKQDMLYTWHGTSGGR